MAVNRTDFSGAQIKPLQVQEGSPTIQNMGLQAAPEVAVSTPIPTPAPSTVPGGYS